MGITFCWSHLEGWFSNFAPDYPSEDNTLEAAWESYLELAAEDERYTDEDGEWLAGYPEKFEESNFEEANDYMMEAVASVENTITECREYSGDPYSYYGVSRSDFA